MPHNLTNVFLYVTDNKRWDGFQCYQNLLSVVNAFFIHSITIYAGEQSDNNNNNNFVQLRDSDKMNIKHAFS